MDDLEMKKFLLILLHDARKEIYDDLTINDLEEVFSEVASSRITSFVKQRLENHSIKEIIEIIEFIKSTKEQREEKQKEKIIH